MISAALPIPSDSRACSKCGRVFSAFGRERRCPVCRRPDPNARCRGQQLTARELEIARLVHEDLLIKEVAYRLGICMGTVGVHLRHILQKTGARSKVGIALWVERHPEKFQSEVAA